MDYRETLEYINSVRRNVWKLGLSRTRELLHMLGDPQDGLKFVHIGGTNGKGSTSAMTESVLRAAGYRTGMFPSPFIEEFRERIVVSGRKISEEDLCRITEIVKKAADTMEDEPSHFEIVTAIGMLYFSEQKCDIVVLEVGLGGEFDATNVIKAPEAAVLTNIGLDHTDYLGTTLSEIARTKAGIVKTGAPLVVYPNVPEVMDVLSEICEERGCEMITADFGRMDLLDSDLKGQRLRWDGLEIKLNLTGEYQSRNAAVALTVIELLRNKGWKITDEDIKRGMADASWPARFEVLGTEPVFILDGGHNSQCAGAVAESLERYLKGRKVTLLIGMLRDKDYEEALDILLPYADKCLCLTPGSDRALPAEELAEVIRNKGKEAEISESAEEAVKECLESERPVLAFGSLYMAGEVRSTHRKLSKKRIRAKAVAAREAISENERIEKSALICSSISESDAYKRADTIFIYKWMKGEVRLDALEEKAITDGKRLLYPLCISKGEMISVQQEGDPSSAADPKEIDLVIAPCSSFDEGCRRLGMGGGYYDRYLPGCVNAKVFAAAFEAQKSEKIPVDDYDRSVDAVITEDSIYGML